MSFDPSITLFKRAYRITFQPLNDNGAPVPNSGVDVSELHCSFSVKRTTLPKKPNTAKVEVYNLSEATRNLLSGKKKLGVSISAGYGDTMSEIYFGEARSAYHTIEGPDIVSHIETGDSEKEIQAASINTSFPPQTTMSMMLKAVAKTFTGVGRGNLDFALGVMASKPIMSASGNVMFGDSAHEMTKLCDAAGLSWSIQKGVFQFKEKNKAAPFVLAFILSPDSGLIGSPEVDFKNKEFVVKAKTLMIPGLAPGIPVTLKATATEGTFWIRDIEWEGSTFGSDWYCKLHLRSQK